MIATCRSFIATRLQGALLWAVLVTTMCGIGCSRSSETSTSAATSTPPAQTSAPTPFKPADDAAIDARARETEAKMSDDERFALLISLIGAVPSIGVPRDKRIPESVTNMTAGYTPGIPRLGIPALQSSDASMGVTNPGYRPDDKGATAFPAWPSNGRGSAARR